MTLFKIGKYGLNTFILVSTKANCGLRDMVRLHNSRRDCTGIVSSVCQEYTIIYLVYKPSKVPESPLHASYFIVFQDGLP